MKKNISKKQDAQPAHKDNRCIWMTAGVISYKLCPINYDCEHCELDKAMRSQTRSRKMKPKTEQDISRSVTGSEKLLTPNISLNSAFPFFTFSAVEVKEELYLHPSHLWVRQIDNQRWRVGIDELLAYVLPKPTSLEFADMNKNLSQDQVFGKILSSAGKVFLTAPLSGRLIQKNLKLIQQPELIQEAPYGEGWLVTIDWIEDRSELGNFFTGITVKKFLQEEAQHLNFFLRHRGVEVNQIGQTLPDGGVNIKYLNQVFPAKVCLRLAVELMVTGKQAW